MRHNSVNSAWDTDLTTTMFHWNIRTIDIRTVNEIRVKYSWPMPHTKVIYFSCSVPNFVLSLTIAHSNWQASLCHGDGECQCFAIEEKVRTPTKEPRGRRVVFCCNCYSISATLVLCPWPDQQKTKGFRASQTILLIKRLNRTNRAGSHLGGTISYLLSHVSD